MLSCSPQPRQTPLETIPRQQQNDLSVLTGASPATSTTEISMPDIGMPNIGMTNINTINISMTNTSKPDIAKPEINTAK
ncbi:hypothetical protein RQN30_09085 [Arcanobacterium hippocoleae]